MKGIREELDLHYRNGLKTCPDDRFSEVMMPFIEHAEMRVSLAETAMNEMSEAYKACVKFYGEDPAIMKPDEFFGIFKTFMSSFEVWFAVV